MSADSLFGTEPERLKKLAALGLEAPDAGEDNEVNPSPGLFIEKPGDWIGPYKLLSILGEGGYGIVFLAEQQRPIKRQVAVKVVKPGMDSKTVIARFEVEQRALALMDHPYIARVHDAGLTASGRPYFVMEHVEGLPITEYCDKHKFTIEERLELFLGVCEAVQHAHQKGIIHRDIKPSNILVSARDQQAVPKIIDFGIAKALTQPLTKRTLHTEQGQFVGTPEYMSPEQADMVTEDIDTRSDIYSLGALLYVLLTGVLPFDTDSLREGGIDHIRQVIRKSDPKTPSTRLTGLGEEAKRIAESRRTEVTTLTRRLHKELEWIPLKAMRKERSERYRSASELADDIENYLEGAPLLAGPLTTGYRLQKFVRRNKRIFAGVVIVAAALVIGLTISVFSLVREQHARRQAQANELQMRRTAYASDMSLAQKALEMNDMARARQLLEAHRPAPGEVDLRGWEWRYLWQECRSDALGVLCRYPPSAFSVAYSPSSEVLAVAGAVHEFVDIWDVTGRKRIKRLQEKEGCLVAFSPRGDLLATNADGDPLATKPRNQIRLWRTDTWDRVDDDQLTLADEVTALKFSPDGTHLASLSAPNELTVWEVNQSVVVRRTYSVGRVGRISGDLDFSPDGKALVIGDRDHHLQVLDLASGNTILDPWEAHSEGIMSVAWSPDGSVIASGSGYEGGPIKLWDAASGKSIGELKGHTPWISDLVFSKDGMWLYSASGDQTIRIWDVGQRRCLATLRGSIQELLGLALSPDGTTLASACKDGVVAFWSAIPRIEEEMPGLIALGHRAWPAFAPHSRVLAAPRAGTVSLFDLATLEDIEQIAALGDDIEVVAYSPNGALLVSGSNSGKIRVWSCVERRLLKELDGHKEQISLLRFRADGTRMLSLDATGKVIWWNVSTWQADPVGELPAKPNDYRWPVDVSPDGRLLVFGTVRGDVCWLNAETGELLATRGGDQLTNQVAFSGDGSHLASTSVYGTVTLWDPPSFTKVASFKAHLLSAKGVAFSRDGSRLATGGGATRDAIKLWDLLTLRELITLPGQETMRGSVVFSNDGRWLTACSTAGNLQLWHAPSWEEIEEDEKGLESGQSP